MLDKPRDRKPEIPRCKCCERDLRLGSVSNDYCSDDCEVLDEEFWIEEVGDAKP